MNILTVLVLLFLIFFLLAKKIGSSVFKKKVVLASPFIVLFVLSIASIFYFSSAQLLRRVLFPSLKDLPGMAAYRPEISVICPSIAYELEAIHLTIAVRRRDGAAKPLRFTIESPAEVEVQGATEREVRDSVDWILIPREQGEYVVVIRGLAQARSFSTERHLSVRKFDGLTRRQFEICVAVASIVTFIAALTTILTGLWKIGGHEPVWRRRR